MNPHKLHHSTTMQRLGIVALGLIATAYLAAITVAYIDELDSPRRLTIFALLWLLGLGAMTLLVRAWRHFESPADR